MNILVILKTHIIVLIIDRLMLRICRNTSLFVQTISEALLYNAPEESHAESILKPYGR